MFCPVSRAPTGHRPPFSLGTRWESVSKEPGLPNARRSMPICFTSWCCTTVRALRFPLATTLPKIPPMLSWPLLRQSPTRALAVTALPRPQPCSRGHCSTKADLQRPYSTDLQFPPATRALTSLRLSGASMEKPCVVVVRDTSTMHHTRTWHSGGVLSRPRCLACLASARSLLADTSHGREGHLLFY